MSYLLLDELLLLDYLSCMSLLLPDEVTRLLLDETASLVTRLLLDETASR